MTMSENLEPIERYLRNLAVPRYVSEAHRRQLRRHVLEGLPRRQAIPLWGMSWKIAVAAVVCVAGVAGALLEARYHTAAPGTSGYQLIRAEHRSDANTVGATNAALTEKDLEGIELVHPQDDLKSISVIESEVDGRLDSRVLLCKYAVPEEQTRSGADPNRVDRNALTNLPAAVWTEISQLRRLGQGENLGTQVQQLKGRPFVFRRERFTLHNGTKIVLTVGAPKEEKPAPK
jgi:hypothetical protein